MPPDKPPSPIELARRFLQQIADGKHPGAGDDATYSRAWALQGLLELDRLGRDPGRSDRKGSQTVFYGCKKGGLVRGYKRDKRRGEG